ncbi:OVARIAN TUMOR DOMAIN-containing deubiquitinating enzyme 7-like isoform X2 [Helianthus annuus]|uniref:OVARIAN TUMOR DOMAIN-containing deubiquitinating enzyme 7-like isoform X2 n=1 Tax=Helianthus annuus TaxID=4232 RepID=UPI000B8FEB5B|nr:OVARIAN TUMOR DOMAIN-containing deubiquitinating enzyme 7-like isoform X2 [Helianthus annuus]
MRLKEDPCNGPATPIIIKADVDLSVKAHQTNAAVSKADAKSTKAESVRTVKAGSRCEDKRKIQQVLLQVDGDVDAAIEVIITGQGTGESLVENDGVAYSVDDNSHGKVQTSK